jgi:hypothetical protein
MDNMDTINKQKSKSFIKSFEKIDDLYRKLGYFQKYGGTVIFVILITIIVIEIFVFSQIVHNERDIKKDWVNQRCKPYIMPLAGFINKPDDQTILDYTNENFTYCIQQITKSIAGNVFSPFNHMTSILTLITKAMSEAIQAIRSMINNFRSQASFITQSIMDRIANVVIPLQVFIITFRDFSAKTNGVITDTFYLLGSIYYTLMSLANTLNDAFFQNIDIPGEPNMCFDKDTILDLANGETCSISNIQSGDTLIDGSVVTAKLILENPYNKMYIFNDISYDKNIIVSGNHRVLYNGNLIYVKDHPDVKIVENYDKPYLYCINTSSKRIQIGQYKFGDWDDLTDNETDKLIHKYNKNDNNTRFIHTLFDGGFHPNAQVDVFNSNDKTFLTKNIKDIHIGDILDLEKQNKVYAIVEVLLDEKSDKLYEYRFIKGSENVEGYNDKYCKKEFITIKGGNHMILNNGKKTDKLPRYIYKDTNCYTNDGCKLYHLLTTSGCFCVNGIEFKDYNSCIENI